MKKIILPLALIAATSACQDVELGYDKPVTDPTTYVKEIAVASSTSDSLIAYVYKDGPLESLRLMNLAKDNFPTVIEETKDGTISNVHIKTLNGTTVVAYNNSFNGGSMVTFDSQGKETDRKHLECTVSDVIISSWITSFMCNDSLFARGPGQYEAQLFSIKDFFSDNRTTILWNSLNLNFWLTAPSTPRALYVDQTTDKLAIESGSDIVVTKADGTVLTTFPDAVRPDTCQRFAYDNSGKLMVLSVSKNRLVFQREINGELVTTILGVLGHGYDVKSCSLARTEDGDGIRVGLTSGTITGYLEFKESACNEQSCKPTRAEIFDLNEL